MKNLLSVWFVVFLATVSSALALDPIQFTVNAVEINDYALQQQGNNLLSLERGQSIDIRAELVFSESVENVRVRATIDGYEYETISAETDIFDTDAIGTPILYPFDLVLTLPRDAEKDVYSLNIEVSARGRESTLLTYDIMIDSPRRSIAVPHIELSPSKTIRAGSVLLVRPRIENFGDKAEEDVRIEVAIPELGVSETSYLDFLENDDQESAEEVLLRIPPCTSPGTYDITVQTWYGRGHRVSQPESTSIQVTEGEFCNPSGPADVSFGSAAATVNAGGKLVVPLTIKNNMAEAKSFKVDVVSTNRFTDVRVSPSNMIVLKPGQSQTAAVTLGVLVEVQSGPQQFTLRVTSDDEPVSEQSFSTTVINTTVQSQGGTRVVIFSVLIVLVICILVALALIALRMGPGDSGRRQRSRRE